MNYYTCFTLDTKTILTLSDFLKTTQKICLVLSMARQSDTTTKATLIKFFKNQTISKFKNFALKDMVMRIKR
jgi:hypothetical protein